MFRNQYTDQYNEVDGHNSINISHTALSVFDTLMCVKGSETKDRITDSFDNEPPCKINIKESSLALYCGL